MKGHIRQQGAHSWAIVLSLGVDPSTGKRRQKWTSVKGTKREAEKKLRELLTQIDNGTYIEPSKQTLAEFLEEWIRDYVEPNLSAKTVEWYRYIANNHLIPGLGNIPLIQLRPEHIAQYLRAKRSNQNLGGFKPLSNQTIKHQYTTLHAALQCAVWLGKLMQNPADKIKPPKVERPTRRYWTKAESDQFLEAIKDSPYHAYFYSLLYTGARRNELLGLKWSDINLFGATIHIAHSKTGRGRTVELPPSCALVLGEYKKKRAVEMMLLGKALTDDDSVFTYADGKPFQPSGVSHAFIKLVRQTGMKPIRLHDLRHSHASIMLEKGIHPKVVQERLGHSSVQVTLDIYSDVMPGIHKGAAKQFDEPTGLENVWENEKAPKS
jgi:integrase